MDFPFTDRARAVLRFAHESAKSYNHEYVGTEHLLIGVAKEINGIAADLLKKFGIDAVWICHEVNYRISPGSGGPILNHLLPYTPRAKRVLDIAIESAKQTGRGAGTEHILIGLVREQGVAGDVLASAGVTEAKILDLLNESRSDVDHKKVIDIASALLQNFKGELDDRATLEVVRRILL